MSGKLTRRALLSVVAGLAAYPLWRYLSPGASGVNALEIPLAELPENGIYMIRDRKAAIIRRNTDIRAISIECTHLGCTLNASGGELICPCHGSRFTLEGKVLEGPAIKDLRELKFELAYDSIRLFI